MARRTAGSVGCGGGPQLRFRLFPPLRCGSEPKVLEKRQGDHHQKRMMVQAGPAAALEVIKPQLLLHLLVPLLTHPARLDPRRQGAERRVRGQVAQVIFGRARAAAFADQPDFVARPVLVRGAWLLGYDAAGPADPALPAFRLLTRRDDRAEPEVAPMGASGRHARLGLADFVTRLLTGGVRFVPDAAGPHLVLQASTCGRCRRDVMVPVGVGNVAGHPILAPGGFLAAQDLGKVLVALDAYRAALPELLRRRPDVAVLREDQRRVKCWVPRCPECDSALSLRQPET